MDSSAAEAVNYLGINFHKLLAKENTNVFFSPLSISTALAMLFCGSEGETAEEMRKVLGFKVADIEEIKVCYQKLMDALNSNQEFYTLHCCNAVLMDEKLSPKEEYKSLLEVSFKALLKEVDFIKENAETISLINEWVKSKTNNTISGILNFLDPSTKMIILNAVYFKGDWKDQFSEKRTCLQDFCNKGDEEEYKQVDMMHNKEIYLYMEKESYRALQLPYEKCVISMLILLPNSKDGLSALENSLSSTFIQEIRQRMGSEYVDVALPKFKLKYSKSLKEPLQSFGLNRVFNIGAHLNGISDSDELFIFGVDHTAILEVNEEGTVATADTMVVSKGGAPPKRKLFIVDHPFMLVIYNTSNNLILFMGRVNEL